MELRLVREEEGSGRREELTVEASPGEAVRDVLGTADINPQTVIVERDGQIITKEDEIREDDDTLRVLDVISGG